LDHALHHAVAGLSALMADLGWRCNSVGARRLIQADVVGSIDHPAKGALV